MFQQIVYGKGIETDIFKDIFWHKLIEANLQKTSE